MGFNECSASWKQCGFWRGGVIICLGINAHLLNTTNDTARVQPGRTTGVWEHAESLRALRRHEGDKTLTDLFSVQEMLFQKQITVR